MVDGLRPAVYTEIVPVEDLRRWIAARRAAERRERAEARNAPPPDPIRAALSLIAMAGHLYGWPVPEDPASVREDALMYERWARLRRRLQGR